LLSLYFLDHVIIGAPSQGRSQPYYSFREAGTL